MGIAYKRVSRGESQKVASKWDNVCGWRLSIEWGRAYFLKPGRWSDWSKTDPNRNRIRLIGPNACEGWAELRTFSSWFSWPIFYRTKKSLDRIITIRSLIGGSKARMRGGEGRGPHLGGGCGPPWGRGPAAPRPAWCTGWTPLKREQNGKGRK